MLPTPALVEWVGRTSQARGERRLVVTLEARAEGRPAERAVAPPAPGTAVGSGSCLDVALGEAIAVRLPRLWSQLPGASDDSDGPDQSTWASDAAHVYRRHRPRPRAGPTWSGSVGRGYRQGRGSLIQCAVVHSP